MSVALAQGSQGSHEECHLSLKLDFSKELKKKISQDKIFLGLWF